MARSPDIEAYIEAAAHQMLGRIEQGIRDVMEADGLTEADLRERGVIVHQPDGRVALHIDGVPRLEWREGPAVTTDPRSTADG